MLALFDCFMRHLVFYQLARAVATMYQFEGGGGVSSKNFRMTKKNPDN